MEKYGKKITDTMQKANPLEKRVGNIEDGQRRRDVLIGMLAATLGIQSADKLASINQLNPEHSMVERLKVFQERFDVFLKKLTIIVKTKNNESMKEKLAIVYNDYKNFHKEYRMFYTQSLTLLDNGRLKASTSEKITSLMQDVYSLRTILGKYFGDFKEGDRDVEEAVI